MLALQILWQPIGTPLGGLFAPAVVLIAAKGVPATFYLAYATSVLWGLAGVVVAQYDLSLLTTGAAALAAVALALVLLGALRAAGARPNSRGIARPKAT